NSTSGVEKSGFANKASARLFFDGPEAEAIYRPGPEAAQEFCPAIFFRHGLHAHEAHGARIAPQFVNRGKIFALEPAQNEPFGFECGNVHIRYLHASARRFTSPYAGRSEHFERREEMLRVGGIARNISPPPDLLRFARKSTSPRRGR